MRVLLFALTGFGNKVLDALLAESCEVGFVFTRQEAGDFPYYPERNLGEYAKEKGIKFYDDFKWKNVEKIIKDFKPNLILVSTFHRIIPKKIISSVPYCINLHPSLLPKYAGATPIDWVLFNKEKKTGVTAHYLTEEADRGDILIQKEVIINKKDSKSSLINKLAESAALVSKQLIKEIKTNSLKSTPQNLDDFQYLPKFKEGIAILGGCLKKGENGKWRTSNFNEKGDNFGVVGDRLRVLASHSLFLKNPSQILVAMGGRGQLKEVPGVPTIAEVIRNELLELGVSEKKIILEKESGNTWKNLLALKKLMIKNGFHRINIVSNKYHLPRIKTFIEINKELKKMYQIGQIKLIEAEKVLINSNPEKWKRKIEEAYKSRLMKERIKKERKGIKDIKSGKYDFKIKRLIA